MNTMFQLLAIGLTTGASMVAAQQCVPLAEAVSSQGSLNRLSETVLSLLEQTGAADFALLASSSINVPESQKITLFAPEDDAWPPAEELPEGGPLLEVILGHVVSEYWPQNLIWDELITETSFLLPTFADTMMNVSTNGTAVFASAPEQAPPGGEIIEYNVESCVGVIHVINKVLLPGGEADPPVEAAAPVPAPVPALDAAPLAVAPEELAAAPGPLSDFDDPFALAPEEYDVDAPMGVLDDEDGIEEDAATAPVSDETGTRDIELPSGTVTGEDGTSDSRTVLGTVVSVAVAAVAALLA